ncbi:hypothetical protein NC651_019566 [Populus alba x Populus x berolinensis]|nr:hypothetical protein NC651_019566 [Populus alba x Populus x berolinensis]
MVNDISPSSINYCPWHGIALNGIGFHRDKIRHNFLKSDDLSYRRTPGIFQQYRYFLGRVSKQRLREAKIQAADYLILLLAGACLGSITKPSDQTFGAAGYAHSIIAVCE